jgi:hypothetical protein
MGVDGRRHASAALPAGKARYPLYKRLGGPQGRSGRVRKISPTLGFDPRTTQPVASRYTDWAIPAHPHTGTYLDSWDFRASVLYKFPAKDRFPLWPGFVEDSFHCTCMSVVINEAYWYPRQKRFLSTCYDNSEEMFKHSLFSILFSK